LAISIGTSHGAFKFTPDQCTRDENGKLIPPMLRFDILKEIEKRIPGFPHRTARIFIGSAGVCGDHQPERWQAERFDRYS
jgi:fructose/tagatose bisphosphate aldolase